MVQQGTLLVTPDGDLDENIQRLRPHNALQIADLRKLNIDWTSQDNVLRSIQLGVTKLLAEADQEASPVVTKKRTVREDDSSPPGKVPSGDKGRDTMETDQGLGGSPVMIQHLETTYQAPRHDD